MQLYWANARRVLLCGTALALASACAGPTPILNSERIIERFGSYGVDVLAKRDDLRVTSLYSGGGVNKTTRTLAVVRFEPATGGPLATAHDEILAGGSIGATLKAHGFYVDKFTLDIDQFEPTAANARYLQLMKLEVPASLALHAYRLRARTAAGTSVPYATIIELHHPLYLTQNDLEVVFAKQPAEHADDDEIARLLMAGGQYADLW